MNSPSSFLRIYRCYTLQYLHDYAFSRLGMDEDLLCIRYLAEVPYVQLLSLDQDTVDGRQDILTRHQ